MIPHPTLGHENKAWGSSTSSSVGRADATAIETDSLAFILCGYDGGSSWLKQNWQINPAPGYHLDTET